MGIAREFPFPISERLTNSAFWFPFMCSLRRRFSPHVILSRCNAFFISFSVAIGVRCKDGIVLAVEKLVVSKLLVKGANRRIIAADEHIGVVRLSVDFLLRFSFHIRSQLHRTHCFTDSRLSTSLWDNQASAGIVADGRHLGKRAREEAQNHRDTYGAPITAKVSPPRSD